MPLRSGLAVWGQRKMVVLALLGFASGLPLYLTDRTLQAWMRMQHVDLTTIGLFSLVSLPYSFKWVWAPLMDRYVPPLFGRRRGWLLLTQAGLLVSIAMMSLRNPLTGIRVLAVNAIVIAFFSASQDVVVDAYRADILTRREMGAGAAIGVLGYRVALLVTGGLAFLLADRMPWPLVYLVLSSLMVVGLAATVIAEEPVLPDAAPASFAEAALLPFREFFMRAGVRRALLVLLFIVVYKLPEYLAIKLATPFLLDLGFSQSEIGAVQGGLGIVMTILGTLAGGALVARIDINRSLWVVGVLGALSNISFFALAHAGRNHSFLVLAIVAENFCAGLVAAVFVAFLMSLCDARYTATQFALLSSLMGVSRDVLGGAAAGAVAQAVGWPMFFLISIGTAVPGMLFLPILAPWNRPSPVAVRD